MTCGGFRGGGLIDTVNSSILLFSFFEQVWFVDAAFPWILFFDVLKTFSIEYGPPRSHAYSQKTPLVEILQIYAPNAPQSLYMDRFL